jgi:hypothetical protein
MWALIDRNNRCVCNEQPGLAQEWIKLIQLDRIAERSYKSYKARLIATERLQARQRAWNTSLLALSVATTIASIALLSDDKMYGEAGPTVLVCVAVLALVASLAVAGLNYGGRSRDMFMNYRGLQRLSVDAEAAQDAGTISNAEIQALRDRLNSLLDDSENHTSADFKRADADAPIKSRHVFRSELVTFLPYAALVIPLLVTMPVLIWALRVSN